MLRCVSLCRGVMNTLHRAAGVGDEGRYLWSWLEATSSISQPAIGPTVSVSEGQAAAAEAQPDSPLMQAAASRPTAISDAAKRLAAAATPSGGKKQRRGFADAVLQDAVSQCKLMAWELKRPSVIPVAQQRAPDAVACWDVRSGDAPPCASIPDRWGTFGGCWCSHQGQAFKSSPGSQEVNQMQARVGRLTWEALPQVWWTTSSRSSASCGST